LVCATRGKFYLLVGKTVEHSHRVVVELLVIRLNQTCGVPKYSKSRRSVERVAIREELVRYGRAKGRPETAFELGGGDQGGGDWNCGPKQDGRGVTIVLLASGFA